MGPPQIINMHFHPSERAIACWLRQEAAAALAAAEAEAKKLGLDLIVYDCYRPMRATQAFVLWAADAGEKCGRSWHTRASSLAVESPFTWTKGFVDPFFQQLSSRTGSANGQISAKREKGRRCHFERVCR